MNKKLNQIIFVLLMLAASISQAQVDTFTVTKTTDFDPFLYQDNPDDTAIVGTLQWAIRKSNDAVNPCVIMFNIPGNGTHTIALTYQLPSLNNEITIDATTQIGYTQWNPAIIIDGGNTILNGFIIAFDNCRITGCYIQNFTSKGIFVISVNGFVIENNVINRIVIPPPPPSRPCVIPASGIALNKSTNGTIRANIIGTDITFSSGLEIRDWGIWRQGTVNNCIIGGNSVDDGNIIAYCTAGLNQFGGCNQYKKNRFINCKAFANIANRCAELLIPVPVLFDVYTSNGFTSGTANPGSTIDIFGSDNSNNANEYLTSAIADSTGNWSAAVSTQYPFLRGIETDIDNCSSILSAAIEQTTASNGTTCTAAIPLPLATYTCSGTQLQITDTVLWMKFTADTSSMRIAIQNPTDTSAINIQKLILYSGDCGILQEIARRDINAGEQLEITKTDFVFGETYLAKAVQDEAVTGWFGACNRLVPVGGVCENAIIVPVITESNLIERFSMNNQAQWLQFIPNTSDIMISILFSDISIGSQINSLTLYSGTCANMQEISSKSLTQNEILNISATNLNPNQTYYIKVTSNNISDDFYRIAFYKKSISTMLNTQSKLLSLPNSQYVDFNDPAILKDLPTNLNVWGDGYHGETPSQCQSIVHDKDGNLLFFIIDNNIYNKNGIPFFNTFFDEPGYPSGTYAFLHDGTPKKCDGTDLLHYNYIDGLAITIEDQGVLGSEITVVPVPKSCNEFFLIYSLHYNSNTAIFPSVFYRKIRIISDDRVFMTEPVRIDPSHGIFDNPNLCSDRYMLHLAITDYRADQEDYILFVNYYSRIFVYQVTSAGIDCSIDNLKFDYIGSDISSGDGFYSEMEIVKTPNNRYLLALPLHAIQPDYLFMTYPYEFSSIITNNYTGGNSIPFGQINYPNWTWFQLPPYINSQIKSIPIGMEFSPLGNRIFFTYNNQQDILFANVAINPVTFAAELYVNNMGVGAFTAPNYENSQIELGRDGNLYLIGNNSNTSWVSRILEPEGLYPTLEENCYVGNIPQMSHSSDFSNLGIYILPDQIDGSDYETYWPLAFYSTPTTFAATEIWTPLSNPFKNGESTIRLHQNLIIPAGKRVTIKNMTLMFSDNSGITLNLGNSSTKGAQLFLENTKITNDNFCNSTSTFWKGIDVEGNNSSQNPLINTQNAYLRVFNNSVIENAKSGVTVYNSGIIKASDAIFKNNKCGVVFKQSSGYTGAFNQTQSSFSNNQFITDNLTFDLDFGSNNDPSAFVKMFNVSSIRFYHNEFKNTMSKTTSAENRGYGIFADNSTFYVLPLCTCSVLPDYPCPVTCFQKNSFEGLFCAIKSIATSSSSATVEHAVFKNNLTAMLFEGTSNNPKVRFNDIDINYTFSTSFIAQPAGYGIYINACYNYFTDENNIYRSENDNGILGLVIYNTQGTGEIYNNTFKNIPKVAFSAIGQNPGVKIVCNKFGKDNGTLGNDFDISVPKYSPYMLGNTYNSTIHNEQFSLDLQTQQELSARNLFYTNRFTTDPKAFFTSEGDYTLPQDYYTYKCNIPLNGQTNWTDFVNCYSNYYIDKTFVLSPFVSSQCPSRLTNGNTLPIDHSTARLTQYTNDIVSSKNELNQLVDKGNTSLLLTLIRNSTNGTYKALCEKLLAASPYLSDTVLLTFMCDQKMYNPVRKSGVILANSPLPVRAKNEIDNMNMPQHFKQEIWQVQTGTNQRVLKEEYFSNLVFEREKLLDNTVCMALNDTLQNKIDSIIVLLQNENTYSAKQILVPVLINKERYSDATYELSILPSLINSLPLAKQQEIYDYINVQNFIIALNQQPESEKNTYIQNNSTFLRAIANTVSPSSIDAQLLLEKAGIENYPEIIALPVITNNQRIINPDNSNNVNENYTTDKNLENIFNVYPNPAHDKLYVEYTFLDNCNYNKIEIFSIDGRVLKSVPLKQQIGFMEINISSLAAGSYYLNICNKGVKNYTRLINIIR